MGNTLCKFLYPVVLENDEDKSIDDTIYVNEIKIKPVHPPCIQKIER